MPGIKGRKVDGGHSQSGSDQLIKKNLGHRVERVKELAEAILSQVDELGDIELIRIRGIGKDLSFHDAVRQFEIVLINEALKSTRGNQRRAARLLGVNYTTLNSMVKRYKIQHLSLDARKKSELSPMN